MVGRMKRFLASYLTMVAILITAVNLILIIFYGRRFLFEAASVIRCEEEGLEACEGSGELGVYLIMINLLIVAVVLLVWLAVRHAYHARERVTFDASGEGQPPVLG